MKKAASLLIVLTIVLFTMLTLSACQKKTQSTTTQAPTVSIEEDTEHATAVATNFINAVVKFDGKTAVLYMSEDNEHYDDYASISVERDIQRLVNEYNDESLKETITEGYMKYLEQTSATVTGVTIDGDTATANYTSMMLYTNFHSDLSLNIGVQEATGVINLIRADSKWLVDTFTIEFVIDETETQSEQ